MSVKRLSKFVNPLTELLDSVLNELEGFESKRLHEIFQRIIIENEALGGTPKAFRHEGVLFSVLPHNSLLGQEVANLRNDLLPQFERWLKNTNNLRKDFQRIRQGLSMVINKCSYPQDVRDVLPEAIVTSLSQFKGMVRIKSEGFILDDHPQLKQQYIDATELILTYQAKRLIH